MPERTLKKGHVIDENGDSLPGALVSVVWGTAPTPETARRTDAAGDFQVALPPGRFRIEAVTQRGHGEVEVEVEVDGEAREAIVIRVAGR